MSPGLGRAGAWGSIGADGNSVQAPRCRGRQGCGVCTLWVREAGQARPAVKRPLFRVAGPWSRPGETVVAMLGLPPRPQTSLSLESWLSQRVRVGLVGQNSDPHRHPYPPTPLRNTHIASSLRDQTETFCELPLPLAMVSPAAAGVRRRAWGWREMGGRAGVPPTSSFLVGS